MSCAVLLRSSFPSGKLPLKAAVPITATDGDDRREECGTTPHSTYALSAALRADGERRGGPTCLCGRRARICFGSYFCLCRLLSRESHLRFPNAGGPPQPDGGAQTAGQDPEEDWDAWCSSASSALLKSVSWAPCWAPPPRATSLPGFMIRRVKMSSHHRVT